MTFLFAFFSIPFYVGSTWILKEISIFYKGSIPFFQTQPLNSLWTNFCGLFFCFSFFCNASLPFCHFLLFYFINIYLYLYFTVIACHVTLISWTSFTLDHFSSPPLPQNSGLKVSIYLKLIFDNIGPLRIHIWTPDKGTRTSGRFLFEYFVIAQKILLCLFIYKYLTKEKTNWKECLFMNTFDFDPIPVPISIWKRLKKKKEKWKYNSLLHKSKMMTTLWHFNMNFLYETSIYLMWHLHDYLYIIITTTNIIAILHFCHISMDNFWLVKLRIFEW